MTLKLIGVLSTSGDTIHLNCLFRYGHELGRLDLALAQAKKGYDIARRGNVAPAVLQDIKVRKEIHVRSLLTST